jgi:hypothetical protein
MPRTAHSTAQRTVQRTCESMLPSMRFRKTSSSLASPTAPSLPPPGSSLRILRRAARRQSASTGEVVRGEVHGRERGSTS